MNSKHILIGLFFLTLMILYKQNAHADWNNDSTNPYTKSGSSFARGEALRSGNVVDATVISVRPVLIESTETASNVGAGAGAVIGGVAGASMARSKGAKVVTGVLGGVIGGAVGQATGEALSERKAAEVILELTDKSKIFVVQEDGMRFKKGELVYLISTGNIWQKNYRVSPQQE